MSSTPVTIFNFTTKTKNSLSASAAYDQMEQHAKTNGITLGQYIDSQMKLMANLDKEANDLNRQLLGKQFTKDKVAAAMARWEESRDESFRIAHRISLYKQQKEYLRSQHVAVPANKGNKGKADNKGNKDNKGKAGKADNKTKKVESPTASTETDNSENVAIDETDEWDLNVDNFNTNILNKA